MGAREAGPEVTRDVGLTEPSTAAVIEARVFPTPNRDGGLSFAREPGDRTTISGSVAVRRAAARVLAALGAADAVATRGADVGVVELRGLALAIHDARGIHGDEAVAAPLAPELPEDALPGRRAAQELLA